MGYMFPITFVNSTGSNDSLCHVLLQLNIYFKSQRQQLLLFCKSCPWIQAILSSRVTAFLAGTSTGI